MISRFALLLLVLALCSSDAGAQSCPEYRQTGHGHLMTILSVETNWPQYFSVESSVPLPYDIDGQDSVAPAKLCMIAEFPGDSIRVQILWKANAGMTVSTIPTVYKSMFTAGVDVSPVSSIRIYPNPARGIAILDFHNPAARQAAIEIVAANGSVVKRVNVQGTSAEIDTRELARGAYRAIITIDEEQIGIEKFVVE